MQNAVKNKGQGTDYLPVVLLRRASVELSAGQPDRAEKDSRQALQILQASTRPGMPSCYMGEAHLTLGRAMQAVNQPYQARAAFRLAAEEFEKAIGPDSPNTRLARQLSGM